MVEEAERSRSRDSLVSTKLAGQSVPMEGQANSTALVSAPATPACNDRCNHRVPGQEARLTFPTGSSTLPLLWHWVWSSGRMPRPACGSESAPPQGQGQ